MKQGYIFAQTEPIRTCVISRRGEFDALFDGFTKMRAISYVVSPDLLLDFFDKRRYMEIEVIVGENLSEPYRQELEQKGIEVTERLAERVENDTLRVLVPDRTIHTKMYLLEGTGFTRVIQSSANLTETARQATRQINYAWYVDIPTDNPFLQQVVQDCQSHRKGCTLFMDDLRKLFRERQDVARKELIEVWLKGGVSDEADLEVKRVLQQITLDSFQEPIVRVRLPEAPAAKKQIERFLAPLNPVVTSNEMQVNSLAVISYVEKTYRFPLMHIDLKQRMVQLGLNGSINICTEPLPRDALVNSALEHIEAYLQTVDAGQTTDPQFVKTSMFEALLYVFFAPFANEYMQIKRKRQGAIDTRGPRFLYVYGDSQNGKTTFLRFALKLLTGHVMEPLKRGDFTKRRLVGAASLGTSFPLVFDDLVPSKITGFEEVLKSYWEVWWKEEYVSPQIIMSSNAHKLQEWAKSRVKRVDFDVHFAPDERSKERLNEIFSRDNPIFKWFSYLYLGYLERNNLLSDDELYLTRVVMKELYEHAQRALPEFFPNVPIEKLYDPGRREWQKLFDLKKAQKKSEKDRTLIRFSPDMQHWEINEYQSYLPQTAKYRRRGDTIIIESPNEFETWLIGQTQPQGTLDRFKNWFKSPSFRGK